MKNKTQPLRLPKSEYYISRRETDDELDGADFFWDGPFKNLKETKKALKKAYKRDEQDSWYFIVRSRIERVK